MEYTEVSMFGIKDEVAIVTGAAGGIGSEIARSFAKLGAHVVLVDLNEDKLKAVAEEIDTAGGDTMYIITDITSKPDVQAMAKQVNDKYGKIDILVNTAGLAHLEDAVDFSEEMYDKVMAVNVKGTMLACQAVGRFMLEKQKGRIVNFSSVRGMQGRARDLAYAPSKGAVDQLTRSLAIEWAQQGVNVNAVAPIFTLTEMNKSMLDDKKTMDWVMSRMPKGKLSQPSYLTGPTVFLCAQSSEFVTGHILYVDGGWSCA